MSGAWEAPAPTRSELGAWEEPIELEQSLGEPLVSLRLRQYVADGQDGVVGIKFDGGGPSFGGKASDLARFLEELIAIADMARHIVRMYNDDAFTGDEVDTGMNSLTEACNVWNV